jgi:hypothetical protein
MTDLVREICRTRRSDPRAVDYVQIDLGMDAARKIFGPRVFDQLRKAWVEDDIDVIWVRVFGVVEAKGLVDEGVWPADFAFDPDQFEYALITSVD